MFSHAPYGAPAFGIEQQAQYGTPSPSQSLPPQFVHAFPEDARPPAYLHRHAESDPLHALTGIHKEELKSQDVIKLVGFTVVGILFIVAVDAVAKLSSGRGRSG